MRFGMEPSRDLGLQHALRNGIALLDGRETGQDRGRVLGGLLEIVGDADRGSGALQEQSLTFALNERSAFERYSLFVRYLSGSIADLPQRLAEARRVLQRVGEHETVDRAEIASVEELLGRLLAALEQDRNLAPLSTVRDVHFN